MNAAVIQTNIMKLQFSIWQFLFFIAVGAFVLITWISRANHETAVARLESELSDARKQLTKTEWALLLEMKSDVTHKPGPGEFSKRGITKELAVRLATKRPNNNYIWWVLTETNALSDGMSLAEAEEILGPATDVSDSEFVYWYDNAVNDPNKLRASRNQDELEHWIQGRDSNFR